MGYYDVIRNRRRERNPVPGSWVELAMADIQPDNDVNIATWRNTLMPQIKANHADANMVTVSGDLVDRGFPDPAVASTYYDFPELFADFEKLGWRREWLFTLSGNHDYNYGTALATAAGRTYEEYLKYNPRMFYYTVQGNVLRIFMGDMYASNEGNITDYVLEWCEAIIARHPRCVVLLYIHQPIAGTLGTLGTDPLDDGAQYGSARIITMLDNLAGKVAMVVSGHLSYASSGGLTHSSVTSHEFKHGCWHVNVGIHIPSFEAYPANAMSYCKFYFVHGSKKIRVRRWNCLTGAYEPTKEFSITTHVPVELSNKLSYDGRHAFDERGGLIELDPGKKLILAAQVDRTQFTDPNWTVKAEPQAMLALYLQDRSADDIPAGVGPSIDLYVPGGGDPEGAAQGLNSMGLGVRLTAVKASGTDIDYTANLEVLTQTGGKTASTLTKVMGFLATGYGYVVNKLGIGTATPTGQVSIDGTDAGGRPAILIEDSSADIAIKSGQDLNYGEWDGTTFTETDKLIDN